MTTGTMTTINSQTIMPRITIITIMLLAVLEVTGTSYTFKANYGIVTTWTAGDKIGIFAESSRQTGYDIKTINASDAHQATAASSNGTGLKGSKRYFALSPYNYNYYVDDNISTALPIAYPTLTQQSNGSTTHLASSNLMVAQTTTTSSGTAAFNFTPLGVVLRINAMVPKTATFNRAEITASRGNIMSKGTLNLETRTVTPSVQSATATMMLSNISVQKGQMLTVYFILPATNLAGGDITATFTTTSNEAYSCTFSGMAMQAGRLYNIGRTLHAAIAGAKQEDMPAPDRQPSPMAKIAKVAGDLYNPTCITSDFTIALNDEQYDPLPPEYILGDANGDGKVNVRDITAIMAYFTGKTPASFNRDAADANKDGVINKNDITHITNIILK